MLADHQQSDQVIVKLNLPNNRITASSSTVQPVSFDWSGRTVRCLPHASPLRPPNCGCGPSATPAGPVVTLGDVAEIDSTDARQTAALAAIELFPAPAGGGTADHSGPRDPGPAAASRREPDGTPFSGSSEVTVQAVVAAAPARSQRSRFRRRRPNGSSAASARPVKYLSEHAASPQDLVCRIRR